MQTISFLIIGFIACAALIIYSGSKLSRYGDIIAGLTGMGKAWFGLIFMAAVTSLPELFTGISSIIIVDSPDIAVGDIMGSCAFNLLILAILDYFVRGKPISSVVTKGHILAGFFGIFLIALAVIAIVFGNRFPAIGWVSSSSIILIIIYLVAMRLLFTNEQRQMQLAGKIMDTATKQEGGNIALRVAVKRYVFFAVMVIAGALALPYFADQLAEHSGISKSFIGTLLVAASTSLPELVVSIAAVRLGSMDIAVGNLLGSNIFNMLILALDDLMYTKGSLLLAASPNHALSGLATLLMTAVAGIGIIYSTPTKRFALGIDAIILIIIYICLMLALYNIE